MKKPRKIEITFEDEGARVHAFVDAEDLERAIEALITLYIFIGKKDGTPYADILSGISHAVSRGVCSPAPTVTDISFEP